MTSVDGVEYAHSAASSIRAAKEQAAKTTLEILKAEEAKKAAEALGAQAL